MGAETADAQVPPTARTRRREDTTAVVRQSGPSAAVTADGPAQPFLARLKSPALRTHIGTFAGVVILAVLLWRMGTGVFLDGRTHTRACGIWSRRGVTPSGCATCAPPGAASCV
ncbi:hypothetical protein ABT136_11640, partial [Streptomyces sp. NPDC001856]